MQCIMFLLGNKGMLVVSCVLERMTCLLFRVYCKVASNLVLMLTIQALQTLNVSLFAGPEISWIHQVQGG